MSGNGNVIFVGHFSGEGAHNNRFASAAGDIVQRQIICDTIKLVSDKSFRYLSMEPQKVWPGGCFYVKGREDENGRHISYVNLPFLKNFIYSLVILHECARLRPALVIQYNSYFFENISIIFSGLFYKVQTCLILQDIRIGAGFSLAARLYDRLANYLVRFFDFVMPINGKIAEVLRLKVGRFHIFKGGITEQGFDLLRCNLSINNYGVFAGALEPHNGIDRLLRFWVDSELKFDLHVFGRGSLTSFVIDCAKQNPYIKFHGFLPHSDVSQWQKTAKFNFCLRYSDGLDEEFFFPSKFFNSCCCPGLLIVNNFKNIPDYIFDTKGLISNIGDIKELLMLSDDEIELEALSRRRAVIKEGSWIAAISVILKYFSLSQGR